MRSFNFTVEGGRENVVNVPIDNPGTATTGRFLLDTGNGMTVRSEVTVTVSGDVATVTIPAATADSISNARWVIQALEGTTPVSAGEGTVRQTASNKSNVEVDNALGAPISVAGTVNLGPSTEIIGYTSATVSRKVGEGKAFITGAAITLGGLASTDRACLQVVNPATSTKVMFLFAMTVYSSITQQVVYMEDATMGGTPTAMTPFNINRAHPATSLMTASYSTAAPTGGAAWPNESRVQSSAPLNLQFPPIVLPPGKSLLIRGTVGDAQTFTANAYWFEE